jgi:hypothetical protein
VQHGSGAQQEKQRPRRGRRKGEGEERTRATREAEVQEIGAGNKTTRETKENGQGEAAKGWHACDHDAHVVLVTECCNMHTVIVYMCMWLVVQVWLLVWMCLEHVTCVAPVCVFRGDGGIAHRRLHTDHTTSNTQQTQAQTRTDIARNLACHTCASPCSCHDKGRACHLVEGEDLGLPRHRLVHWIALGTRIETCCRPSW